MFKTPKTELAFRLLRNYARTPGQREAVDELYEEVLHNSDNEDQVIIYMIGLILDGLRYGNWLWNMPPNAPYAQKVPPGEEGRPGQ
ncbi:MAG TPA: hypothetical protein VNS88_09695 [Nitrospiraceae bacterium]|nr:hypothetical protein [Nitrospiraceae bacterium]